MTAPNAPYRAPSRLLVVEDSATQAAALMALLEEHGFAATRARGGEQALELLRASAGGGDRAGFALVLSDVVMPGMSGYELCRAIKGEPWGAALPVVLLTSLGDPLALVRGLESGADHYVTKPYEPERLVARVRQVIASPPPAPAFDPCAEAPAEMMVLGSPFTIAASRERIIGLLVSSYEDLVRTSQAVRAAEQRARFLAEAGELLSSSLDAERVLRDVARLAVPRLADVCSADVADDDGRVRRVEVAAASPARAAAAAALGGWVERWERLPAGPGGATLATLDDDVLWRVAEDESHRAALRALGAHTALSVPLVARGTRLGTLTLMSASEGRGFAPDDVELAIELARRAALALDNARLYSAARQATQSRDDMLAIVSHDLRNPLHTIMMSAAYAAELLPDPAQQGQVAERLAVIRRSTTRANTLIQDLLDVSRIEAGRLGVTAVAVDGRQLLEEIMLDLAPLARAKPLTVEYAWEGEPAAVSADRERVAQVLSNLVGNALKFTPKGGHIAVRGRVVGAAAEFEVADDGPGIPAASLPNIFDRFWQADGGVRQGAGLGLFIVRGIVEAHGGRVEAESVQGAGTTFRFTLPLTVPPAA